MDQMLKLKDTGWLNGLKKYLQEIHLIYTDCKWRDGKRYSIKSTTGIAILTSDKTLSKTNKSITMLKESIWKEAIIFINIYTLNLGAPKYTKQILRELRGEVASNKILGGDFNTPLASMSRLSMHSEYQ